MTQEDILEYLAANQGIGNAVFTISPGPISLNVGEGDYSAAQILLDDRLLNLTPSEMEMVLFLNALKGLGDHMKAGLSFDDAFVQNDVQVFLQAMWWTTFFACQVQVVRTEQGAEEQSSGISSETAN